MKRINNLYQSICSLENLQLADQIARKGKSKQRGVKAHIRKESENLEKLRSLLLNKEFTTSPYKTFMIKDPKERQIFCLPYFPDRIVHHAIMNVLEPVFVASFTADTYSCIKGRGIKRAADNLKKALTDVEATTYCLKLDIRKFYPSIDHDILKDLLRRKIKDRDLLWLLDDIIDSAAGVPIGNYLSQYMANYYLSPFDHWIKEQKRVKYYFRYADDIVILHQDKDYLHTLLKDIRSFLDIRLKLEVKSNYQVFPVQVRGIDFVGYVFRHTHTLLRKSIKKNFAQMIARRKSPASIAAYNGWAKHCNSKHLLKKLLHESVQGPEYNAN